MRFVLDSSVEEFLQLHARCRNRPVDPADVLALTNEITPEAVRPEANLNELSGGQSHALMIADIALICDSPVVLIDEIENAGIDKERALNLLQIKEKLVLVVTHDPHTALIAQQRIVLRGGAGRGHSHRGRTCPVRRTWQSISPTAAISGPAAERRLPGMTHVTLYWSHICVLHRQEELFLEQLTEKLRGQGIELDVHYFGLGYPQHMSEYLAQPDAVLPDVILSADLEVFEDPRIYRKIQPDLYAVDGWVPLRNVPSLPQVRRAPELLPVVAIPLVYYTRTPDACHGVPLTEQKSLAFGGINNSAVKTVAKYVWETYGQQATADLLQNSLVTDMPIGAFQAVRQGQADTALCPSLYALRADGKNTFLCTPQEGPVLIPSYFCARKSVPEDVARLIANEILCQELCDFYVANGELILYPTCTTKHSQQEQAPFACPTASWLSTMDPQTFYDLYTAKLPTAKLCF